MSDNVELVRSIYADWERGDFSSADVGQIQVGGAWDFYIRDVKVVRMVRYMDRANAVAAVGVQG